LIWWSVVLPHFISVKVNELKNAEIEKLKSTKKIRLTFNVRTQDVIAWATFK
jgi:hypothetical protein